MVHTRAGTEVVHAENSYGRAAYIESARKRKKRKMDAAKSNATNAGIASTTADTSPRTMRTPTRTTRLQAQSENALASPPSAARIATPPSRNSKRLLRRASATTTRKPRCSDYGSSRHFAFKGGKRYFFCSACDLWDALPPDASKKISMDSLKFGCKANHTYFSHPTTLRKEDCYSGRQRRTPRPTSNPATRSRARLDMNTSDNESSKEKFSSSSDSSTTSSDNKQTSDDNNQPLVLPHGDSANDNQQLVAVQAVVEQLKGKVVLLQGWNRQLSILNRALQCQVVTLTENRRTTVPSATAEASGNFNATARRKSKNCRFASHTLEAMNDVITGAEYRRWSADRIGQLVARMVWKQDRFRQHLIVCARKYFRENVFTPFNILREMDLAGGTLSYEGIDVLRCVETNGVKGCRGAIIPSKSELKRMASKIEWFAKEFCPFHLKQTTSGESVQFEYAKLMLRIAEAFHLDEIGKMRSLSVACSIDGASLSKNLSIIAGGIKIIDRGARCPITGRLLLDNPLTMSAQSRRLCIPFMLQMGRETKETFAQFASLFTFIDKLADTETLPPELRGFLAFLIMTNCDLSAQWKGMCKGGATKVHTLPCTGCATESDALATPNATPCARWCTGHSTADPDWMCFHKPMATPERVDTMKAEVTELLATLETALVEILAKSQMSRCDVECDVPTDASSRDTTSIHFCPQNASEERLYSRLLTNESILRGISIDGSMETRRERLRVALKDEATIARLSKEISHGEVKEGAYFVLMSTLPCVLHMENRNGIKILTMLLIEGLSNAKKRELYIDVNAEGTRVTRFVSDMENLINQSILGTPDDPCQWMCPFDSKKKELGPITMDNVRTRRIIDALDIMVDACVTDNVRTELWMVALNNYRISMVLLRKREDFTNESIAVYQDHADKFFQAWIKLWQKEGITNYIHMIGSGHVADYLYKWNNLYRYSQQGWEAMNSLIKTFFFRRTSHGGGVKGASKKSRLIPIARWLQRRMVFLCRVDEHTIHQYIESHPMPPNFRTQALSQDDIYE